MTNRKENLKNLFRNSRTRLIILLTFGVLIVGILVGVIKIHRSFDVENKVQLSTVGASGINSVPGSTNPVPQYAKLQQQQNRTVAQNALSSGDSSIPTIVSTQNFGDGVQQIGATGGSGSLGFDALSRRNTGGETKSLSLQQLRQSNCDSQTLRAVMSQGVKLSVLKGVCSCAQLHQAGVKLDELKPYCSCKDLKAAGFNVLQLKAACFDARRLRECGFNACQLKSAGFSATAMKNGGFSDGELKGSGFTPEEIKQAGGLPDGVTATDVREAGCSTSGLQTLRERGVTAGAIRRISGCSASQLKAAGFDAKALREAGYNAADLKNAGFTAAQLKDAGYSATQLKQAGFSDAMLGAAGFTPAEIDLANQTLPPGIQPADIEKTNCQTQSLARLRASGVSAAAIKAYGHCSAKQLKAAGYSGAASPGVGGIALPQGIGLSQVKAAGCDAQKLQALRAKGVTAKAIYQINGCSAVQLKKAGYDATSLKSAGFTDSALATAGFSPAEIASAGGGAEALNVPSDATIQAAGCDAKRLASLRLQGASATRVAKLNGCNASNLRAAGFDATALKNAGFSDQQLKAAGFSDAAIQTADRLLPSGVTESDVKAAGCDAQKLRALRAQGVSAAAIHKLNGCSASALKAAGFDAVALKQAGFSDSALGSAGYSADQIAEAASQNEDNGGVEDSAIDAAGCDTDKLSSLRQQGISASAIRQRTGCSASQLKAAGYTAVNLKRAGLSNQALKAVGFSEQAIESADLGLPQGVSAQTVKQAGCSAQQISALRRKGVSADAIRRLNRCSANALKAAGFGAADLLKSGFSQSALRQAGFSQAAIQAGLPTPSEAMSALRKSGCSDSAIKQAKEVGLSASEVRQVAGCSASQLLDGDFNAAELKQAGFTAGELKSAGVGARVLRAAGYDAKSLAEAGFDGTALKEAGFTSTQLQDADVQGAGQAETNSDNGVGTAASPLKPVTSKPDTSNSQSSPGKTGKNAGLLDSIESAANQSAQASANAKTNKKLQDLLKSQQERLKTQRYQQKIQQAAALMNSAAAKAMSNWSAVPTQSMVFTGAEKMAEQEAKAKNATKGAADTANSVQGDVIVKAGDIMYAVMTTSVNSDEPGPVLAQIVSGKFKHAKIIGSFSLPSGGQKLILTFNKMSVPGVSQTVSINAVAIDPNTARTALADRTNNHYLLRYGSLFASSFLTGFGDAFESQGTTITIGDSSQVEVESGIGRSALENAVIGLADVGTAWGDKINTLFDRPATVEIFAGTGIGLLFTQDLQAFN